MIQQPRVLELDEDPQHPAVEIPPRQISRDLRVSMQFEVAALFGHNSYLRRLIDDDCRRKGIPIPPDVIGFLNQCEDAHRAFVEHVRPKLVPSPPDMRSVDPPSDFVTSELAALALNITRRAVTKRCKNRKLRSILYRRRWYIDPQEFEK